MNKSLLNALFFFICTLAPHALSAEQAKRNVILFIGDGMDDTQVTIARNYLLGASGKLVLDNMPYRGTVQVLTVEEDSPSKAVYVADSANSATSIATGKITSRGRIATSAKDDQDLTTIVELARAAGFANGIVSTADVTDATPASFVAHVSLRACENPNMMVEAEGAAGIIVDCSQDTKAQGGKGSIAEQIADTDIDVVLGGGHEHFKITAEQSDTPLHQVAQQNNYQYITNLDQLKQVNPDKKLLGLFSEGNLPVRMRGEGGRGSEAPKPSFLNRIDWRLGSVTMPEPMHCEPNPEFNGVPQLQEMTLAALNHLSKRSEEGFFLMVESASIDKQAHARKPCGSIGELEQLEESVSVALEFAKQHPDTLILITADHGQAAQIIPDPSLFKDFPVAVYPMGLVSRIITPEQQIMTVNYATVPHDFPIEEHTGTSVPIYSNQPVPPMLSQPEIFSLIKNHLEL